MPPKFTYCFSWHRIVVSEFLLFCRRWEKIVFDRKYSQNAKSEFCNALFASLQEHQVPVFSITKRDAHNHHTCTLPFSQDVALCASLLWIAYLKLFSQQFVQSPFYYSFVRLYPFALSNKNISQLWQRYSSNLDGKTPCLNIRSIFAPSGIVVNETPIKGFFHRLIKCLKQLKLRWSRLFCHQGRNDPSREFFIHNQLSSQHLTRSQTTNQQQETWSNSRLLIKQNNLAVKSFRNITGLCSWL